MVAVDGGVLCTQIMSNVIAKYVERPITCCLHSGYMGSYHITVSPGDRQLRAEADDLERLGYTS